MFNYQLTQAQVLNNVQVILRNLRTALEQAEDLYGWSSGIAASDLETLGFDAGDAQDILNAIADANSLAGLYNGGSFSGTLPYNFSASQRTVLGPS